MINRIIAYSLLFCLIVAIPLALMGIDKVELGAPFLALMRNTSMELNQYKIAIPDIPDIPMLSTDNVWFTILNGFIWFVNTLADIINIISMMLNVVISLIQFIVLLVKNLIAFKDTLASNAVPVV